MFYATHNECAALDESTPSYYCARTRLEFNQAKQKSKNKHEQARTSKNKQEQARTSKNEQEQGRTSKQANKNSWLAMPTDFYSRSNPKSRFLLGFARFPSHRPDFPGAFVEPPARAASIERSRCSWAQGATGCTRAAEPREISGREARNLIGGLDFTFMSRG